MKSLLLLLSTFTLSAQDPALDRLQREIERLAPIANGAVGITAIHLESGRQVSLRPAESFPMASTVKVPLAVHIFSLIDEGKLQLDQMVTLQPSDLHPGSGTLTDLFNKPGVALSLRNLLELTLLISDNSATDILLRLGGGAPAVNARLQAIGISGIRADRPTALLISDAVGYTAKLPAPDAWTISAFSQASRATSTDERNAAIARFQDDPRDTSTPSAMAALLARIHNKEILSPSSNSLLNDILRRCRTGDARLKGLLPANTTVAHKTGSMPLVVNDVGIITLPANAGHIAIAAFTKKAPDPAKAERAIAEIARATHDFFLFQPTGPIDFDKLARRVRTSLQPTPGEKFYARPDPGYLDPLAARIRHHLRAAGAIETRQLNDATIYLWLPLRPGGPGLPPAERAALKTWTDQGGPRRQIHFHWGEGSVSPDGLYLSHSPQLDTLYQQAIDIDYDALSAAQSRVISQLRSGLVRVRTPHGTNLTFRTANRPFNRQDGDASQTRMQSAQIRIDRDIELPAGVVRVAPIEESASGTIVIPAARLGPDTARNITLTIVKGRITKFTAAENLPALQRFFEQNGEPARRFREFALGMNPVLTPPPASPVLPYYGYGRGVVRLSLGDNEELGGNVLGGFTRWFFFPDATIDVNGKPLSLD